ncbi:MAG: hypothetical protein PHP06_05420 [Clostridia bacterium]|nr:hypothetical protein [Clostridia bacterium]
MDKFHEEVVIKEKTAIDSILYGLSYALMIIFGFLALNFLFTLFRAFSIPMLIFTVLFAAISYGAYLLRNSLTVEYEYTFTNGELDFAKVIMNSKRKELLTINVEDFEVLSPITNNSFKGVLNDRNISKTFRFHRNKQADKLFYATFNDETGKKLLIFEPSNKLVDMIKIYIPSKVIV